MNHQVALSYKRGILSNTVLSIDTSLKLLSGVLQGESHALCLKGKSALNPFQSRGQTVTEKSNEYFTGRECRAALQVTPAFMKLIRNPSPIEDVPGESHVSDCLSSTRSWFPLLPVHRLLWANRWDIML